MSRQLLLLFLAFAGGTAIALLAAKNFGTAMGIGQLCFAAVLVFVLLRD
jgi:hypothetical protein